MKKRKFAFVTLVVLSVSLLILLYINYCKPYIVINMWLDMWQEILVDRYENNESYFDDMGGITTIWNIKSFCRNH